VYICHHQLLLPPRGGDRGADRGLAPHGPQIYIRNLNFIKFLYKFVWLPPLIMKKSTSWLRPCPPFSPCICHAKGSMSVGEAKESLSYSGTQAGPTQREIFNSSVTASLLLQVWNHRTVRIFCRHTSI